MSDFWQRAFVYPFFLFLLALLVWAVAGALPAALFFGIGILLRLFLHLRNLDGSTAGWPIPRRRTCRTPPACGRMHFRNSTS